MKKSIKRLLIMAQVLGLSALAATACTKNASETKPAETSAKKDDASKKSTDASVNNTDTSSTTKTTELDRSTLVNQSKVVKDTNKTDNDAIRNELLEGVFKNILNEDLIPAQSENNANGLLKSLPEQFPVITTNDKGAKSEPNTPDASVKALEDKIFSGDNPSSKDVVPAPELIPPSHS